ncbi:hypothetical protein [Clostridium sp.]|uniref:hypothetical protein n=1 Tax=Clostridium sp. TaxID=1506 RepID=UPI003464262B
MKKLRGLKFILLIMLSYMIVFPFKSALAKDLEVDISSGFDKQAKVFNITPVNIKIKNLGEDIQGSVEVVLVKDTDKAISYKKDLSMSKGSEKDITIDVFTNKNHNYKVVFKNKDSIVYDEDFKFTYKQDPLIGILSDDINSIAYFNKIPNIENRNSTIKGKIIGFNEKNFPEKSEVLDNFTTILIENFDTSKLSSNQYEAIKNWVNSGGILYIGTGDNYKKTLGIFKDDFLKGKVEKVEDISTDKLSKFITDGKSTDELKLRIANMNLEGKEVLVEDKGNPIIQYINKGEGKVVLAGFSFGISPVSDFKYNEEILYKTYSTITASKERYSNREGDFWSIRQVLRGEGIVPEEKQGILKVIFVIYLILVAPVSYIVLKKLDKRELMWITVPVTSLVFSLIIYSTLVIAKNNSVDLDVASVLNLNDNGILSGDSYGKLLDTSKEDFKVSYKDNKLIPVVLPGGDQSKKVDYKNIDMEVLNDSDLVFKNKNLIADKMFKTELNAVEVGKIDTKLGFNGGKLQGTIKNNTSLDLESVFVVTPSGYFNVGNLSKGEEKSLEKPTNIRYYYEFTQSAFGDYYSRGPFSKNNNQENFKKGMMTETLFRYNMGNNIDECMIIAFTKDKFLGDISLNDSKANTDELSIIKTAGEISFKDDSGNVYYPEGMVKFEAENEKGVMMDQRNHSVHGYGSSIITYNIEDNIEVSDLMVAAISNKDPNTVITYFDNKDNDWKELNGITFTGEGLKNILKDNKFKIKIDLNNGYSDIPSVGIKGKVK